MLRTRPKSLLSPQNLLLLLLLFLLLLLLLLPPLLKERVGMRMLLPKGWPQKVAE